MKPSPSLSARLRFSTKDVGKGFYRGNRTGSMGAHTPMGGYIIDYRKVRNYNVPDLTGFKLTPYVTKEVGEVESPEEKYDWENEYKNAFDQNVTADDLSLARRTRAIKFLHEWRRSNPQQYQEYLDHQVETFLQEDIEKFRNGERVGVLEQLKHARQKALLESGYTTS